FFVTLKPWSSRETRAEQFQEIKQRLNQQLSKLPQGTAFSFSPPAIPGVGTSGGFQFVLEDRAGRNVAFLAGNLDKFMAAARKRLTGRIWKTWGSSMCATEEAKRSRFPR